MKKYWDYSGFFNGEFQTSSDPNGSWKAKSPADLNAEAPEIKFSYAFVDSSVESARRAFKTWRMTSVSERISYLRNYQSALKAREADWVSTISFETGKPHWESKTEFASMIAKIDISITDSLPLIEGKRFEGLSGKTDGEYSYKPFGVMAVIGPFNFPGHLPNGHVVPALFAGNTVVFKPSEKTPMTAMLMALCFSEAKLPSGVFNLVLGEKEIGRRLCVHESVNGILFTGSYEVGTRIKQDTLNQHWKILALEMGGKNSAIITDRADFEVALRETLTGAYLTAGQRCTATNRVLIHRKFLDQYVERAHKISKNLKIGPPEEEPFMGPVIDSSAVERYTRFLGIAAREGNEIVMRGKPIEVSKSGHYVSPSICVNSDGTVEGARKSVFQQTELFCPNLSITVFDELEQAVELANATQYGLASAVFSSERQDFDYAFRHLDFGLINWNKTTVGASSKLPFGGVKKSGNHQPTALFSTRYCAYPVASLEESKPTSEPPVYLGLQWN